MFVNRPIQKTKTKKFQELFLILNHVLAYRQTYMLYI